MRNGDYAYLRAYGIRKGDRLGILIDERFDVQPLLRLLERVSCTHLLLKPSDVTETLSTKIRDDGIRLILASSEMQGLAANLRVCVASANAILDSAPAI
jgi:hypothetical protein